MAILKYDTGGGCTAYRVTESDAPGFYALVTDEDGSRIPECLESDKIMIGAFRTNRGDENPSFLEVIGRPGLIEWYEENVGHDPDKDMGGTTPILELLDRVASLVLLYHALETSVQH